MFDTIEKSTSLCLQQYPFLNLRFRSSSLFPLGRSIISVIQAAEKLEVLTLGVNKLTIILRLWLSQSKVSNLSSWPEILQQHALNSVTPGKLLMEHLSGNLEVGKMPRSKAVVYTSTQISAVDTAGRQYNSVITLCLCSRALLQALSTSQWSDWAPVIDSFICLVDNDCRYLRELRLQGVPFPISHDFKR